MSAYAVDFNDIQDAGRRIQDHIHKTPVLSSSMINQVVGAEIFFKCENFQAVICIDTKEVYLISRVF